MDLGLPRGRVLKVAFLVSWLVARTGIARINEIHQIRQLSSVWQFRSSAEENWLLRGSSCFMHFYLFLKFEKRKNS